LSRRGITSTQPKAISVCLPMELWPEADQLLWKKACGGDNLLEDGGFGRNWRPATAEKYSITYGRWLAWIIRTEPKALNLAPLDRITKNRIRAYVDHMRSTLAPYSVASLLRGMGSIAWAFSEANDYYWIVRFSGRLAYRAVSTRNKRQIVKPSYELVALGLKLMASAVTDASQYRAAIAFRNGLIIALLAHRPIRRTNLTSIAIGKHLMKRDGGYVLNFTESETKQHKALEVPVPESLSGAIDSYLEKFRPYLMGRPPFASTAGQALWVAADGGALSYWGIYAVVTNVTRKAFGHALNPHIFRDCAATTVAIDDPSQIAILADVLGHSNLVTSAKHYNQARCIDASRRFQNRLAELKRETGVLVSKSMGYCSPYSQNPVVMK
jgi:integrase/recombinase XerD